MHLAEAENGYGSVGLISAVRMNAAIRTRFDHTERARWPHEDIASARGADERIDVAAERLSDHSCGLDTPEKQHEEDEPSKGRDDLVEFTRTRSEERGTR